MTKPIIDPWLLNPDGSVDPFSSAIDFSMRPEDAIDPEADPVSAPILNPEVIQTPKPEPVVEPVVPVIVPPVEPEPEAPEVHELEDGTQLTLEKDKGQWKGSVIGVTGNPQVYWGKNKNELIVNILKAQANATKKIREQNLKLKLGTVPAQRAEPLPPPQSRQLTAEETFEIKTQMASDPDLAMETWFQKKTGRSVSQLVDLAEKGSQASLELQAESVNKEFLSRNPDYYADPEFKNFASLVKYVSRYKLGKTATDANANQVFNELVSSGNWTVENIEEAFEDLKDDMIKPRAPKIPPKVEPPTPVAVQTPPEPAPAPPADPRIVSTVVRPRAGLGIRSGDVTPAPQPASEKPPSAEDLESMSDEEIRALWNATRRRAALNKRG